MSPAFKGYGLYGAVEIHQKQRPHSKNNKFKTTKTQGTGDHITIPESDIAYLEPTDTATELNRLCNNTTRLSTTKLNNLHTPT